MSHNSQRRLNHPDGTHGTGGFGSSAVPTKLTVFIEDGKIVDQHDPINQGVRTQVKGDSAMAVGFAQLSQVDPDELDSKANAARRRLQQARQQRLRKYDDTHLLLKGKSARHGSS